MNVGCFVLAFLFGLMNKAGTTCSRGWLQALGLILFIGLSSLAISELIMAHGSLIFDGEFVLLVSVLLGGFAGGVFSVQFVLNK
jgi:hypothetical protein